MSRCVLTLQGVAWLLSLGALFWLGLFAAAALINRWTRGQGPIY